MNKYLLIIFISLFVACSGAGTSSTTGGGPSNAQTGTPSAITGIPVSNTSQLDDYSAADFSTVIFFHKTENKILVSYNFFPNGSDVCEQSSYDADTNPNGCRTSGTVVLPCGYEGLEDNDYLSIDVSAFTTDTNCTDKLAVSMTGGEFTVDGLVFSFASSLDVFVSDFGFKITRDGFVDSENGSILVLSSSSADLQDVYESVLESHSL